MEMKQSVRPAYRRRNFLIKKGLQGTFVIGLLAAVISGILLNLALVYIFLDRELTGELYKIHLTIHSTSELAWPVLWKMAVVTLPVILIVALGAVYYFTRRLEAPLYSFIGSLRRFAAGDFSGKPESIAIEGLTEALDKAHGGLESRFSSIKGAAKGLEEAFARVKAVAGRKHAEAEFIQAIGEFSRQRSMMRREVRRFNL